MKIGAVRSAWTPLLGLVGWISTLMAAFLTFNITPSIQSPSASLVAASVQFGITALFGILIGLNGNRMSTGGRRNALVKGAVLLVVFFFLFLCYVVTSDAWTCNYASRFRLVIGPQLSSDAATYAQLHPQLSSCEGLIGAYGGDNSKVYDASDVQVRFVMLAGLYAALWSLAAAIVFFIALGTRLPTAKEHPARSSGTP